jgi:hypothetical protein
LDEAGVQTGQHINDFATEGIAADFVSGKFALVNDQVINPLLFQKQRGGGTGRPGTDDQYIGAFGKRFHQGGAWRS